MEPLKKFQGDPVSVLGAQSHRQGDRKVEIQITDRRKDMTGG